jgi:hypothetical protein
VTSTDENSPARPCRAHVRSGPGPEVCKFWVFAYTVLFTLFISLEIPKNKLKQGTGLRIFLPMTVGDASCRSPRCHPNLSQVITRGIESVRRSASFRGAQVLAIGSVGGPPRSISPIPTQGGSQEASTSAVEDVVSQTDQGPQRSPTPNEDSLGSPTPHRPQHGALRSHGDSAALSPAGRH